MKKSLVAMAALAFAGMAAAQSSVTLYGVADIYVAKPKGAKVQAGSGGVATSRWGIKGEEDLGGGLKANFNYESGISLANGAVSGALFSRQANVGVSGGFGTIKLGKSWNALDDVFGAANSGFDSALSANKVWLNGYAGEAVAQIYYATPSLNGFAAAVSTQLNGNSASTGKTSALNVTYAQGPLAVALGYEDNKNTSLAPVQKGTMLNGSYDLGSAKLLGSYYTTKPATGARTNSYQLGADVPLTGALTLSVGYANSKVSGGKADSALSLAGAYSLSKRTLVYAGYRAESRKSGAADNDLWAVGINHKF